MKNDPAVHATGSSNPALNVIPFDTLKRILTERHYHKCRAFSSLELNSKRDNVIPL
jgi:hypothetical protein